MTHEEIRELIHPYVDGELDVANGREIEQHLGGCDECRRLEQRVRTLRAALRKSLPVLLRTDHSEKKRPHRAAT